MAKKMYLVPKELLALIEEKQRQHMSPLSKTVMHLDRQMEQTLDRPDLPPDQQVKLYDKQLQRWSTYQEKQHQPIPIVMTTPSSSETELSLIHI